MFFNNGCRLRFTRCVTICTTMGLLLMGKNIFAQQQPRVTYVQSPLYGVDFMSNGISGASAAPAGEVLRAQLKLPEGQGVVITGVTPNTPAAKAGFQKHDVLLSVKETPLNQPNDFVAALQKGLKKTKQETSDKTAEKTREQTEEKPDEKTSVRLMREGKEMTIEIEPKNFLPRIIVHNSYAFRPDEYTLYSAAEPTYYIGVSVDPVDDLLKSQLGLKSGMLVTDVTHESPAMKAGLTKHDILIAAGEKTLSNVEDLRQAVNEAKEKSLSLRYLREGEEQTVEVTPEKVAHARFYTLGVPYGMPGGSPNTAGLYRLWTIPSGVAGVYQKEAHPAPPRPSNMANVEQQIGDVAKQLQQLHENVKKLRAEIQQLRGKEDEK